MLLISILFIYIKFQRKKFFFFFIWKNFFFLRIIFFFIYQNFFFLVRKNLENQKNLGSKVSALEFIPRYVTLKEFPQKFFW
jgi:hypothetical protein